MDFMSTHFLVLLFTKIHGKCPLCKARFENPILIRKYLLFFLHLTRIQFIVFYPIDISLDFLVWKNFIGIFRFDSFWRMLNISYFIQNFRFKMTQVLVKMGVVFLIAHSWSMLPSNTGKFSRPYMNLLSYITLIAFFWRILTMFIYSEKIAKFKKKSSFVLILCTCYLL